MHLHSVNQQTTQQSEDRQLRRLKRISHLQIIQIYLLTPAETAPLSRKPWIRSYEKQVMDLTEVRGRWNVAYIYNKESLRKALQHHRKGLLLGRAICRWIAICYSKVR